VCRRFTTLGDWSMAAPATVEPPVVADTAGDRVVLVR
jgi:hypothetical protein